MSETKGPTVYDPSYPTLCDERGRVDFFMVIKNCDDYSASATVYDVQGWEDDDCKIPCQWEAICPIYLKCDGCCHMGLAHDGMTWAHVCGAADFERVHKMLRWAWVTLQNRIGHYDESEKVKEISVELYKTYTTHKEA